MSYSYTFIKFFFIEVYKIIKQNNPDISEVWCEFSDLSSLSQLNEVNLKDFINNFDFLSIEKGNYINYLVINKILFIIESLKFLELDIRNLSELLDYKGFEALVQEILVKNGYRTTKNFRFTDKSNFKSTTSQKRYEIDVIGINRKFMLIIDAKQWKNKDSYSAINRAANLQYQRVLALKKNPETFSNLIQDLQPNFNRKTDLPFILIPIMLTLEDNTKKINENNIPLVSIYEFNSFLQELQNYLHYYKTIKIHKVSIQTKLG